MASSATVSLLLCAVLLCLDAQDLQASLRMAQCRATCLRRFVALSSGEENDSSCLENRECLMCWETCKMLAGNFPIWSVACAQKSKCQVGCQVACGFHTKQPEVVPLSRHNSRLTLVFSGSSAQWTLTWDKLNLREHVVYSLFTHPRGRDWKLKLQTASSGASLEDVVPGTDMKLVAVAESGILSAIITPYAPQHYRKPPVALSSMQEETNSIDGGLGFSLFYIANVEDSGLVTSRVWWDRQGSSSTADYLVTWEVSGGGLKGHLFTDIPEVELKLWPETTYKVQVEVVTGPLGDLKHSRVLTLDTHNITLEAEKKKHQTTANPTLPLVYHLTNPFPLEVALGASAGGVATVLLIVFVVWRKWCSRDSICDEETSPEKWGGWEITLSDAAIGEDLAKAKAFAVPVHSHHMSPVLHTDDSFLNLSRPSERRQASQVNIYSVMPFSHRPQVSSI